MLDKIIEYAEAKLSTLHPDEKDKDYIGLIVEVGFLKGVVELLKEQPKIVHCKDCKWSWHINPDEDTPFYVCKNPMLCNMRISHEGDWHCGDGELRDGEQE